MIVFIFLGLLNSDFKECFRDLNNCKNEIQAIEIYSQTHDFEHETSHGGRSFLHLSAIRNWPELTTLLIKNGADVNLIDEDGLSPLAAHIQYSQKRSPPDLKMIGLLIEHGAKVDFNPKHSKQTLIHHLFYRKKDGPIYCDEAEADLYIAIISQLIAAGIDIWMPNFDDHDLLSMAAFNGNLRLVRKVFEWSKKIDNGRLNFAFISAAIGHKKPWTDHQYLEILNFLLEKGADINGRFPHWKNGDTALHAAVAFPEALEFLIKSGAEVDKVDYAGKTPLMRSLTQHAPDESTELLIKAGADLTLRDRTGNTVIYWAINPQKIHWIDYFIAHGVDIQLAGSSYEPLFRGVETGNREIVSFLLRKGARFSFKEPNTMKSLEEKFPPKRLNFSKSWLFAGIAHFQGQPNHLQMYAEWLASQNPKPTQKVITSMFATNPRTMLPYYLNAYHKTDDPKLRRMLLGQILRYTNIYAPQIAFNPSGSKDEHSVWMGRVLTFFPEEWDILTPYAGLGFRPSSHKKGVQVKQVFNGFGAERAGLKEGDIITHVEGLPIDGHRSYYRDEISGPEHSMVNIRVLRNQTVLDLEVERDFPKLSIPRVEI